MEKKRLLTDVVIIRPLIIGLLVVYHAFIIYNGGWREPIGFVPVKAYGWIADFLHSFRMQVIIFIAGYVYSYQVLSLKRDESLGKIVTKKFKRLILPSLFFSLIYFFMFYDYSGYTIWSGVVKILSGAGHMWFLPMLFWCFVFGKLLNIINLRGGVAMAMLILVSLMPFPIPFGIGRALHYMVFFWTGFLVWKNHDVIVEKFCTRKGVCLTISLFALGYFFSLLYRNHIDLSLIFGDTFFIRGSRYLLDNAISLVVTMMGIGMVYVLVNYFVEKKHYIPSAWVFGASSICYGVYVYQQFILQVLYYKTNLSVWVGPYWLPWIGCFLTFCLSIILAKLTLKTRFGRFLIG